jgi:hypothetical protein
MHASARLFSASEIQSKPPAYAPCHAGRRAQRLRGNQQNETCWCVGMRQFNQGAGFGEVSDQTILARIPVIERQETLQEGAPSRNGASFLHGCALLEHAMPHSRSEASQGPDRFRRRLRSRLPPSRARGRNPCPSPRRRGRRTRSPPSPRCRPCGSPPS